MKKKIYPTEVLEVEVMGLDSQGMGVVEYWHPPLKEGCPRKKLKLTIPQALPGDVVRVTVPNAKGRRRVTVSYDEIVKASKDRIGFPPTDVPIAGGTPLLYMSYAAQLDYKERLIQSFLEEKGFDSGKVRPVLGIDDPYHYRNKMELTFGKEGAIGMHQAGNFRCVIDLKDSPLAPQEVITVKETVSEWQKDHQLPSYDKESNTGLLRHLMVRKSHGTGEIMVAIFATEEAKVYLEETRQLVDQLQEKLSGLASVVWLKNTDIADRTQSQESEVLFGRDYIHDQLHGYQYRLWFDTFFQPNPLQAEKMVDLVLEMGQIEKNMRVLDLFCGVGTFSLPLADRCQELAGIEIVPTSIESAKRNALENGLENTYFISRDARKGMAELEETWGHPDLLLLDPPRSGAGGKVMRRIGRLGCQKVIYVSCNPKTLADDLVWLREFGYELQVVQPVDQFPHTLHVESVVLMSKAD